jgi:hypothetical protein
MPAQAPATRASSARSSPRRDAGRGSHQAAAAGLALTGPSRSSTPTRPATATTVTTAAVRPAGSALPGIGGRLPIVSRTEASQPPSIASPIAVVAAADHASSNRVHSVVVARAAALRLVRRRTWAPSSSRCGAAATAVTAAGAR